MENIYHQGHVRYAVAIVQFVLVLAPAPLVHKVIFWVKEFVLPLVMTDIMEPMDFVRAVIPLAQNVLEEQSIPVVPE